MAYDACLLDVYLIWSPQWLYCDMNINSNLRAIEVVDSIGVEIVPKFWRYHILDLKMDLEHFILVVTISIARFWNCKLISYFLVTIYQL